MKKRTVIAILSLILVASILPINKVIAGSSHAADIKSIKQVIFRFCHATKSGIVNGDKPYRAKVKFIPIEFVGDWATTSLIFYPIEHPKNDDQSFQNDSYLLLKKSNGHWKIVAEYYGGSIKPSKAKQIGLTAAVAKKLHISITSEP